MKAIRPEPSPSLPKLPWFRALQGQMGVWLETRLPRVYARLWTTKTRSQAGHAIPWTPLRKPLSQCRAALVTTGGVHLRSDRPYAVDLPAGDPTFRVIPSEATHDDLMVTHIFYDHTDVDRDVDIMLPLKTLHAAAADGRIGMVAHHHFGFNGSILDTKPLIERYAPEVARRLQADQVDVVILSPG